MLFKALTLVNILTLFLGPVSALVQHGFSSAQLALIRKRLLDGAHARYGAISFCQVTLIMLTYIICYF
jgi:hypothetical protein